MDKVVLAQKLESLRRCIQRIEEKTPESPAVLAQNADLQDVIVLNLTRAVQLSVDLSSHIISQTDKPSPQTMGAAFSTLEELNVIDREISENPKKAVGFRNIAVHNYEAINWAIVFSICKNRLEDFRNFARAIVDYAGL